MERKFWFPAKRYGWGWGPPVAWQGWAVLGIFFGLVVAGVWWFPPQTSAPAYVAYVFALSVALTLVCWITGEKPRWRWGDRDERARKEFLDATTKIRHKSGSIES
jgi:drug/metabolite transporter (DMT)-like permease